METKKLNKKEVEDMSQEQRKLSKAEVDEIVFVFQLVTVFVIGVMVGKHW